MTFLSRLDPEYLPVLSMLSQLVPDEMWSMDAAGRRKVARGWLEGMMAQLPPSETVTHEDRQVAGVEGQPEVSVRIFRPVTPTPSRPGVLYLHGGGMWGGSVDGEHLNALQLSEALGAVVVSVEYRLAPEHPHPAPVLDCYGALKWMAGHAGELGFDRARLGVFGGSAGGGLALGVALMARDQGGPAIRHVMAPYPMVDDRNTTASSLEFTGLGPVWDREKNLEAWGWYLGGKGADLYAAPSRAEDLSGLPAVFMDVGELDLFRDEDVAFAVRLMQAGVPVELHVYPGAFHACENIAPQVPLSQRIVQARLGALKRHLID